MDAETLDRIRTMAVGIVPAIERTGIEILELEPGRATLRMPLEPNVNHVGTMYAGALFTLAEAAEEAVRIRTGEKGNDAIG